MIADFITDVKLLIERRHGETDEQRQILALELCSFNYIQM